MKETFSIPDIHCSSCVMLLEELEDELIGVSEVSVNLKNKTAVVTYDETITNEAEVIKKIDELSGYKASPYVER